MDFWFDDARKTLIASHDNCAVGIRPIESGIEFFTPDYQVMAASGNIIFPGYILIRATRTDFGASVLRAAVEQCLKFRSVAGIMQPGTLLEECRIVHTYSRDTKMYPEIDNDGFLTFRLLSGAVCRMAFSSAGMVPEWVEFDLK